MNSIICIMLAATTVFRLEVEDETQQPFLVGADNIRRPVVLLDPDEYQMMSGRLEQVWKSMNATEDGRTRLHGKRAKQEIDADGKQKITTYEDGYRHVEDIKAKIDRPQIRLKPQLKSGYTPVKPSGVSSRQWEMRQKLDALKNAPAKEVTVEHDAATGKDKVIE